MSRPIRSLLALTLLAAPAAAVAVPMLETAPATAAVAHVDEVRLNGFEARLVADINAARRAHGLRSLVVVPGATDVARRWAWREATGQRLWHNPQIVGDLSHAGSGAWTEIAENVGMGPSTQPQVLFTAYMHSPEHRANILDRQARYVGVGTVERGGVAYNTLDFTNAYSHRYGDTRVPAAGLTMDGTLITHTTDIAMLETNVDQRFTTRHHGGVSASRIAFTGPGAGNDAAVATLHRSSRRSGRAVVLMRDAMDLGKASHLQVQLGAHSPRGVRVPVEVVLRRSFGPSTVLGVVHVGGKARWTDLALPRAARDFRNTLVLRVSGTAVRRAGGTVRLAVYDVRAAV